MNIEALKCRVNMLKRLLDDPQPGLTTWNIAVEASLKDIVDFAASPAAKAVCKCEQIHVSEFADYHTEYAVALLGLDPWKTDTSKCEIHGTR